MIFSIARKLHRGLSTMYVGFDVSEDESLQEELRMSEGESDDKASKRASKHGDKLFH